MPLLIRPEQPDDIAAIHAVNAAAFETGLEAALVDTLRTQAAPFLSLVAEDGGHLIGHILFTPVALSGHAGLKLMGLAPMAVLPARQRQGTGSALIRAGLDACRELGCGAVVVLGHAEYYPRFGFRRASDLGILCEFEVPPEYFMLLELIPGYLHGKPGTIHYHDAFKA